MNIYLLKRNKNTDRCDTESLVVAASNENEARELSFKGDFGLNKPWLDSRQSNCALIGEAVANQQPGLLCLNHVHG